jgi:hypothetical protein
MYEIEGGKVVETKLKPLKIQIINLGQIKQGEHTKYIVIGDKKYR